MAGEHQHAGSADWRAGASAGRMPIRSKEMKYVGREKRKCAVERP